jgi:hypothetical protein
MKEINRKVPLNTKVLPTSLTKRACEEKMKSCFFDILIAQDTIAVLSFKLVLLPLEKFLVLSLSINDSQVNTLSLLQYLDCQIHRNGAASMLRRYYDCVGMLVLYFSSRIVYDGTTTAAGDVKSIFGS